MVSARKRPSGEKVRKSPAFGKSQETSSRCVGMCQSLTERFIFTEAKVRPSGENATAEVSSMWPGNSATNVPGRVFQRRMVPSRLPLAKVASSAEKASPRMVSR